MLSQLHRISFLVGVKTKQKLAFFVGRKRTRHDDVPTRGEPVAEEDTARVDVSGRNDGLSLFMDDGPSTVFHFHDVKSDCVILLSFRPYRSSVFLLQSDQHNLPVVVVLNRGKCVLRILQEGLFVVWAAAGLFWS